ncbi:hypothetical protein LshimejAT787_0107340 [Lyophyllum shimeji]|uniref:Uncharacterized protein n=1 Tax=Lyophyllum shimeji TaxID=47721 RepID=A0A9P3UJX2_LYOSH|nr:hypothetical protein LshimejAT787_0107340 [Lyophyllum shimeji]
MASSDTPDIQEFIAHPDYQQIAAFFLGAVFITSLNHSCLWIRRFFPRIRKWMYRDGGMTTDINHSAYEKASIASSSRFINSGENQSLVFTLSLCFAFASIAYVGSLLSFSPKGGATCAFLVAWGGMAAQTARLIGLFILLLELKGLGAAKLEVYLTLACLSIAMVLVFVNNAIGTGALRFFAPLDVAICYRKHFLPTALASSFMQFLLELFVLLRLGLLIMRQEILAGPRLAALRDSRIVKALSLLFLELLTIAPSAVHISVLADFIPLSIGALAVLAAFNHKSAGIENYPVLHTDQMTPPTVAPVPTPGRSGWFSRGSFRSSSTPNTVTQGHMVRPAAPATIRHPFSAQYLNDTTSASPRHNQQLESAVNTATPSIHSGVIQTVERSAALARARAVVVSPADIEAMPQMPQQRPPEVLLHSLTPGVETANEPPLPVPQSVSSPSSSPTSILMHPWHERRQPRNARVVSRLSFDGSEEVRGIRSSTSTKGSTERTSYILRGSTFSMPPVPSPSAAMRRYSSATLTSPMFSQEGGEGSQPRPHVQLLTFESNFRTSGERVAYRTPPFFGGS